MQRSSVEAFYRALTSGPSRAGDVPAWAGRRGLRPAPLYSLAPGRRSLLQSNIQIFSASSPARVGVGGNQRCRIPFKSTDRFFPFTLHSVTLITLGEHR